MQSEAINMEFIRETKLGFPFIFSFASYVISTLKLDDHLSGPVVWLHGTLPTCYISSQSNRKKVNLTQLMAGLGYGGWL